MPSHKIHLKVAEKVNDILKLDLDSVMLGSVLPDLTETNHMVSHFQNEKKGIEGTANPDLFIENFCKKLDNPIVIGYLIHILTDKYFNEFMFDNFYIFDENNKPIGLKIKGKNKYLKGNIIKNIKHQEFDKYDKYLLNNKKISKFNNYECVNKIDILDNFEFNKEKLKKYIDQLNKDIDKITIFNKINFTIYKLTSKKEFDKQIELCCNYIINYLNNNLK